MTIEITAGDHNKDGSITIKVDGQNIKYVLESDLGAVKSGSVGKDTEISKLQADLATSNSKYDTEHQSVLQERAAKEVAEREGKESATLKGKVGELETELTGLKTSSGEVVTKLTDRVRKGLVEGYKIDADKVKDMALEKLEETEASLVLVGAKPAPANYDGKGGESGSSSSMEGMSAITRASKIYDEGMKSK